MKPGVRVLYVHHSAFPGGAEQSLLDMLSSLDRKRFCPAVAIPDGPLCGRLADMDVKTYLIPSLVLKRTRSPFMAGRQVLEIAGCARAVCKAAVRHEADIVHANSVIGGICAGPAARNRRSLSVLHVRDMIDLGLFRRIIFGCFDRTISISRCAAEFYSLDRVEIIPCGIDTAVFDVPASGRAFRERYGLPGDSPVVGMVSQLVPWKNHTDLLKCAAAVISKKKDACFAVAGATPKNRDAAYENSLHSTAGELGIEDRVRFIGWCDDMPGLYSAVDVLVHTACNEPFGRAVAEAMICGVPVVAYNSGGPAEIIANGRTGVLVNPGDTDSLAANILEIITDSSLRSRISAHAREDARSRFDARHLTPRITALYAR